MSNVSSLSAKKFERHTVNLLFKETANRRDISIFFFFCELFFILYFYLFTFFFLFLSPGCSSSIAISFTLIDRSWTLIPNIPESGALDINLVSSLSRFRNSGFHSSLSPTRSYVAWPFVFPRSLYSLRLAALYFRPFSRIWSLYRIEDSRRAFIGYFSK